MLKKESTKGTEKRRERLRRNTTEREHVDTKDKDASEESGKTGDGKRESYSAETTDSRHEGAGGWKRENLGRESEGRGRQESRERE